MFKYKGVVYKVGNLEVISEKFSKRELVLTDAAEQYPQFISFTFVKDKCALLDNLAEGQETEVSFSLKGREWTSPQDGQIKYFNTVEGFAVTGATNAFAPSVAPSAPGSGHTDDDLPF
jgi:single-strand DNA-binding protein